MSQNNSALVDSTNVQMSISEVRPRRVYLSYVHNFRGFAITLIIATHCLSMFDWSGTPILELAIKRLVLNGTILFLFIAGYLFQHLADGYQVRNYLWKKVRFVILPYLIASIPAILLFTLVMHRPDMREGFYDQPVWQQVVEFLVTGSHLAPFWFIPTIVLFYLASPLLHWLDRQSWFYYFLPFTLLIPLFVSRGAGSPFQSFVHFIPVWLLGMACSRHRELSEKWLAAGLWWLFGLFAVLLALEVAFTEGTHSGYSTMGKIALTLCLFELFRRWGNGADRWFALAGTLSFGLFFVHSYVISSLKLAMEKGLHFVPSGSLWAYGVSIVVAMWLSSLAVQAAVKVFGRRSRMVIGV